MGEERWAQRNERVQGAWMRVRHVGTVGCKVRMKG